MRPNRIFAVNIIISILPATRLFGLKRRLWSACGADIGPNVKINTRASIYGGGSLTIGADTWVGIGCTFIVPHGAAVSIGGQCDLAPDVLFECGSHEIGRAERRAGKGLAASISIGSGTWIGARVVLLGGAEIGSGCIVAAGAVVRAGSYPENTLIGGIPARVIRTLGENKKSE